MFFGEANQFAADADAAARGVHGQHPELAGVLVESLDADAADDPPTQAGHRELARPRQLGDLVRSGSGRAFGPQPVLGHGVDIVGQNSDPLDERRVVGRGGL